MSSQEISDQLERDLALDITQSFIVQAPAGSGKTELLTQRYLALLAAVDKVPEQVVAITFTKKAQAEMRQRIIKALMMAKEPPPDTEHALKTWQLAKSVLLRDDTENWHLLDNPNRLAVQTIDGLCAGVTSKLPILSGLGRVPEIVENAKGLYEAAATKFFNDSIAQGVYVEEIKILLLQSGHRLDKIIQLFANLLENRNEWLPYCYDEESEDRITGLHAALFSVNQYYFTRMVHACDELLLKKWLAIGEQCALYLGITDSICFDYDSLKQVEKESLDGFRFMLQCVFTKTGDLRRSFTKNQGFPAPSSARTQEEKEQFTLHKKNVANLRDELSENSELLAAAIDCLSLPDLAYEKAHWHFLNALLKLLPIVTAHLHVLFANNKKADFLMVSLRAIQALGDDESPSDLMLALDNKIQHLLVDEFQDTSHLQWKLLERLVVGWQPGEGRSIFLVGDPMQSIYRFRHADVSLFLRAKKEGIADISLKYLRLSSNFRTQSDLVTWCNALFARVFPEQENHLTGAICFEQSLPQKAGKNAPVIFNCIDTQNEAQAIISHISAIRMNDPKSTIAVLARSRSHIVNLCQALEKTSLCFQAIDIDPLIKQPIIQDMLTVCRCFLHEADQIAWLALLRSPLVGLSLKDITAIVTGEELTVWSNIKRFYEQAVEKENPALIKRLKIFITSWQAGLALQGRVRFSVLIESVWEILTQQQLYTDSLSLRAQAKFLDELVGCEHHGPICSYTIIEESLQRAYMPAIPDEHTDVCLLTIHKAKGLEFDYVIMPHLGAKTRSDDKPLLTWQEFELSDKTELLLAASAHEADGVFNFVRTIHKEQLDNESRRLLYVALTRAKKQCLLFGDIDQETAKPKSGCFLSLLWDSLPDSQSSINTLEFDKDISEIKKPQFIYRRSIDSLVEKDIINDKWIQSIISGMNESEPSCYRWQPKADLIFGQVIHQLLEQAAAIGFEAFFQHEFSYYHSNCELLLKQKAIFNEAQINVLIEIKKIYQSLKNSSFCRWLLGAHQAAKAEWPLFFIDKLGNIKKKIIDRTFVYHDVRYIIDYKSSSPTKEQSVDEFMQIEWGHYKKQLLDYASLLQNIDSNHPIVIGLYFPLIDDCLLYDFPSQSRLQFSSRMASQNVQPILFSE